MKIDTAIPSPVTLAKYGLSEADFIWLLEFQDFKCAICGKQPNPSKRDGKVRFCIDHEHVRGWKAMPPEKRKQYVRGLLCWVDNLYIVGRGVTIEKLRSALAYLEAYARRTDG